MAVGQTKEVSLETLAAIAEQGGASEELVKIQFGSVQTSVPKRIEHSEAINADLPPAETVK